MTEEVQTRKLRNVVQQCRYATPTGSSEAFVFRGSSIILAEISVDNIRQGPLYSLKRIYTSKHYLTCLTEQKYDRQLAVMTDIFGAG